MYAQIVRFGGPRSDELVAAGERAGRERVIPAVAADPRLRAAHRGTYILRTPDGGELVLVLSDRDDLWQHAADVIDGTALLPGEDPALLTGPDGVEQYRVVAAFGADYTELS